MPTVETVPLANIKLDFFVRLALNEHRVAYFLALRESGQPLPSILLADDDTLLDGRHRLAAADRHGDQSIDAVRTKVTDQGERIFHALSANLGGAQPPTLRDLVHTLELFLDAGWTHEQVIERLAAHFPAAMLRKMLAQVKLVRRQRQVHRAVAAMRTQNLTLAQAAKQFGVTETDLRQALGQKGKFALGPKVDEFRRAFKGASIRAGTTLTRAFESYHDGIAETDAVDEALDAWNIVLQNNVRTYRNYVKRWLMLKTKAAS